MNINVSRNLELLSFVIYENDSVVGRANVCIHDDIAELADIKIAEVKISRCWFVPYFKKIKSYRNKGYSSALLTRIINDCICLNVKEIHGVMHGDIRKLKAFYGDKFGFNIDGKKIKLSLNQPHT